MISARHLRITGMLVALGCLCHGCGSSPSQGGGAGDNGAGGVGAGGTGGAGAAGQGGSQGGGGISNTGGFSGGLIIPDAGAGSGGSSGDSGDNCGEWTFVSEVKPANILLVIDKSGSMLDTPGGGQSKWEMLKPALSQALNATKDNIRFGLELFPYWTDTEPGLQCGLQCCSQRTDELSINVPIDVGARAVPVIMDKLAVVMPGGGTPTSTALGNAISYFRQDGMRPLDGENYVLLATDGAPNCNGGLTCEKERCTQNIENPAACSGQNCCVGASVKACLDDSLTLEALKQLAEMNVKTFVVGIPGTELYADYLRQFAIRGGVPKDGNTYYAVNNADELAKTFTDITVHLVRSCVLSLTEAGQGDPHVFVDFKELPSTGNWDISDDRKTVTLKGDVCEKVMNEGANNIKIYFGCIPPA